MDDITPEIFAQADWFKRLPLTWAQQALQNDTDTYKKLITDYFEVSYLDSSPFKAELYDLIRGVRFGHYIRVPVPTIYPTPYYRVLNLKTGKIIRQRGRYTFRDYSGPRDPIRCELDWIYMEPPRVLECTLELKALGISQHDLVLCRKAVNNRALQDVLDYIPTTPAVRKKLYQIFAHDVESVSQFLHRAQCTILVAIAEIGFPRVLENIVLSYIEI